MAVKSEEIFEPAEAGSEGPQPVGSETGSDPGPNLNSPKSEPSKAESQPAKASGRKSSGSDNSPFAEGEKVLAYHGPMIYGAKTAEVRGGKWFFHLHYLGWNKKWDEWAPADRLLKDSPENQAKSQKLAKKLNEDKTKDPTPPPPKEKPKGGAERGKGEKAEHSKGPADKGRRRKSEVTEEIVNSDPPVPSPVIIKMPQVLQNQLIEDWKRITEQGKLVQLPRKPSVNDILLQYEEADVDSGGVDSTAEMASGLKTYFERALPAILLYKQERQQYVGALEEGGEQSPSEVYGAEHLLRLFIKLPDLLSSVPMERETLTLLKQKLHHFLKYLVKMQSVFFAGKYYTPEAEVATVGSEKERGRKRLRR